MQMLYVPWVGERYSIFCGKANASGPAHFCNLEGPLPAGGEFVEPCSVQSLARSSLLLHEPLMIAPERLVVAWISDCCSPPSFINEVHIVTPQLFLHGFIKSLDPWRAQVNFLGKACFSPVDQEERGLPGGSAGCGPVAP